MQFFLTLERTICNPKLIILDNFFDDKVCSGKAGLGAPAAGYDCEQCTLSMQIHRRTNMTPSNLNTQPCKSFNDTSDVTQKLHDVLKSFLVKNQTQSFFFSRLQLGLRCFEQSFPLCATYILILSSLPEDVYTIIQPFIYNQIITQGISILKCLKWEPIRLPLSEVTVIYFKTEDQLLLCCFKYHNVSS